MAHSTRGGAPVVGLSGSVLDTRFSGGRLDGIGTYTLALERALRGLGVTTLRVGTPRRQGACIVMPEHADLAFRLPLGWSMAATALTSIATPFAAKVERTIDVYHCTDYLIPRLRRTPVVATLYDAIPLAHPEWANQRLRRVKNWLLRAGASDADLVIAISHAAVEDLVEHYKIPAARIRIVPLGVDDKWFAAPSPSAIDAICRTRGVRAGCFLFVGTLQPRKNLGTLIAAYDSLPAAVRSQHQLIIAGQYGWGAEDLRTVLEARRGGREVIWLDYVSREELHVLYAIACALVFPSLSEGFGLPVLEALASGTAVIASDLPVLREVAGHSATFINPRDIEQLADAMNSAANSSPGEETAAQLRAWAQRFQWSTCASRTLAIYSELC
jgi:glycosyltransferase involved in cell wall biosynthesis